MTAVQVPEEIETKRLILRCPRETDGAAVNAAIRESIETIRRWMPWAKEIPAVAESEAYLRGARVEFMARRDLPFLIFLKGSQEFIGGTGLHRMDWAVPSFEIGYWLRDSAVGQGHASEAVRGLVELAVGTLNANRVEIRCSHRNVRSQRVAEGCGFQLEARLRNQTREPTGELRDTMVYVLIPDREKRPA